MLPIQVIVPVGQVPPELWLQYCNLLTKHRQIDLQLLRSFYKEQQKSPFTHLPWKAGALHFRFPAVSPPLSRHVRGQLSSSDVAMLVYMYCVMTNLLLQDSVGMQKDLMAPLYTHRKVLGVIGICHGPAVPDIKSAYESFGKSCR